MQYIVEFSLKDRTKVTCITNNVNKSDVRNYCINTSNKIFNRANVFQSKMRLDKNMSYTIDAWKADHSKTTNYGYKKFAVAWVAGTNSGFYNITAAGEKTAYNNLIAKIRMTPTIVFIYDTTQVPIKKSSKAEAQKIIANKEKADELIMQVAKKSGSIPGIGAEMKAITLMLGMVKDYINGSYKEIPLATIVSIVGTLVYFISPVDAIPDTIPVVG